MVPALRESMESFVCHLERERRLSPRTVSSYQRDLEVLRKYCEKREIFSWDCLNPAQARGFVGESYRRGLSGRSISRMLSSSRSFFRYQIREGLLQANPFDGIRAPKSAKSLPKVLTVEQAMRLVELEGDDMLTVRDRAIVELFYSSGLRLSELAGLDVQDLDLNQKMVRVQGKGSKTRIVPVGSHCATALRAWLSVRAEWTDASQTAVFVSARRTRITSRAIQKMLERRALAQGIELQVHPHVLRHSFATHVLESSGDIRAVQELLGHSNLSTTQIYTHLDFGHLSKEYDRAHPRARKK